MDFEAIRYEVEGGVATLTLNRPEKRNAYTPRMGDEVVRAFRAAREDDAVRAVILTGAGKGFCAGVDLDALKAMQAGEAGAQRAEGERSGGAKLGEEDFIRVLPLELLSYPKPVIAAIHGAAIGVGVTMVLPCDIRIAAEDAKLGLTFTKLGILPGLGSTHLLPRLVGMGKAQELVLTARVILAPEALAIGLVNRVVPGEALLAAARETAELCAACDPDALAVAKRALHAGASSTMAEAMEHEKAANAELRELKAKRGGSASS